MLRLIQLESESEVAQQYPTLCDPMDCSLSGSSIHGIFQARVLEWIAIFLLQGIFLTQESNRVSRIAGRCFTIYFNLASADLVHFLKYLLYNLVCKTSSYCKISQILLQVKKKYANFIFPFQFSEFTKYTKIIRSSQLDNIQQQKALCQKQCYRSSAINLFLQLRKLTNQYVVSYYFTNKSI